MADASFGLTNGYEIERREMSAFGLTISQPTLLPVRNRVQSIASVLAGAWRATRASWQVAAVFVTSYMTIIALVAIYDIHLTIRYASSLKQYEENPLGRWLMNLDRIDDNTLPDLTLFLSLKAIGTLIVLATVLGLVRWRGHMGHAVGMGVTSFQLGLACYLTYVDPVG